MYYCPPPRPNEVLAEPAQCPVPQSPLIQSSNANNTHHAGTRSASAWHMVSAVALAAVLRAPWIASAALYPGAFPALGTPLPPFQLQLGVLPPHHPSPGGNRHGDSPTLPSHGVSRKIRQAPDCPDPGNVPVGVNPAEPLQRVWCTQNTAPFGASG